MLVAVSWLLLLPLAAPDPHNHLKRARLLLHLWPPLVAAAHLLPPVTPPREVPQLFGSDFALDPPETRVWVFLSLGVLALLGPTVTPLASQLSPLEPPRLAPLVAALRVVVRLQRVCQVLLAE